MFWRHKDSMDKPFILIGSVALLGVAILAGTLIYILSRVNNLKDKPEIAASAGQTEVVDLKAEEAEVVKKYNEEILSLKASVSNSTDLSDTLPKVVDDFFNIHVPKERLEKHFKTMLKLKRILDAGIKDSAVAKKDVAADLEDLLIY